MVAWLLPGKTLRGRLMASYVVVLLVTVVAVAAALSVLLPTYRTRLTDDRLVELSRPTLRLLGELVRRGATTEEMRSALADQMDNGGPRVLLVTRGGQVVFDSLEQGGLEGKALPLVGGLALLQQLRSGVPLRGRFESDGGQTFRFAALPLPPGVRQRGEGSVLLLAQPEGGTWQEIWAELGWRLAVAAAVALLVATAIAWLVARSIYRPIARLTDAAEAMASGRGRQQVPVDGPHELAGLAAAFNRMVLEVQASEQAMRDFVANVSHDLRTPLTTMRGFVEALRDGTVTEGHARERSLDLIDAGARRMQRLVSGLLELSRLESGHVTMRREPVDAVAVVRACLELAEHRAGEAGVVLGIESPAVVPPVLGDADRLEQVVTNLIDNALRYTPPGGRVVVGLVAEPARVRVQVRDTGRGIPRAALPHVFDRFYTADPARASGGGAGLGLAIAREIVIAHGGDIVAESEPGAGSVFTVTLPAAA